MPNLTNTIIIDGVEYSVAPRVLMDTTLEEAANMIACPSVGGVRHFLAVLTIPTADEAMNYGFLEVNGTTSTFMTCNWGATDKSKTTRISIDLCGSGDVLGTMSIADANLKQPGSTGYIAFGKFWTGDDITSFAVKAYGSQTFPAGTRFCVEGY